jgi:predicted metal-dependent hydrolase
MDKIFFENSIECACHLPIPPIVRIGLESFNAGHYFEAHEFLEEAWRNEQGPVRELFRGILQVGVGFYHIQHSNFNGAHKLFQRALGWLTPFPSICQGINVDRIRSQTKKIDSILFCTLSSPSKVTLESLFFIIQFDLIDNGDNHV